MINSIKKFRQVNIHHIFFSTFNYLLCRFNRLLRTVAGTKTIAVIRKCGINYRFQKVLHRGMHNPVPNTGNPQQANTGITWFWYFHPFHRAWFITPAFKVLTQLGQLFIYSAFKFCNGYTINTWCPAVPFHCLETGQQVSLITQFLEETSFIGRTG
ncbi:uncharacterized protein TOL2_C27315 [Desulfobacula toluolica Tol2]|uniref:Uncharacterized protein n=1 Tax=Desulfobacula toluolica (strain DSM 7467 / Tol2) TaxID=651182 RepID=K0NHT0_DESTT|nr:uncharacterized protein TOL2_C27315 [Desulfobacula toluolica Tol2]